MIFFRDHQESKDIHTLLREAQEAGIDVSQDNVDHAISKVYGTGFPRDHRWTPEVLAKADILLLALHVKNYTPPPSDELDSLYEQLTARNAELPQVEFTSEEVRGILSEEP